jgi:hypothetical protein
MDAMHRISRQSVQYLVLLRLASLGMPRNSHEAGAQGFGRTSGRQHVLYKHEDGLLWANPDPLADDVHKLPHSEVSRHQIPAR